MNSIIKLLAFYLDICYRFKNKSILNLFKGLINIEEQLSPVTPLTKHTKTNETENLFGHL